MAAATPPNDEGKQDDDPWADLVAAGDATEPSLANPFDQLFDDPIADPEEKPLESLLEQQAGFEAIADYAGPAQPAELAQEAELVGQAEPAELAQQAELAGQAELFQPAAMTEDTEEFAGLPAGGDADAFADEAPVAAGTDALGTPPVLSVFAGEAFEDGLPDESETGSAAHQASAAEAADIDPWSLIASDAASPAGDSGSAAGDDPGDEEARTTEFSWETAKVAWGDESTPATGEATDETASETEAESVWSTFESQPVSGGTELEDDPASLGDLQTANERPFSGIADRETDADEMDGWGSGEEKGPISPPPPGPRPPRKKAGLFQILSVVGGGLLSLPIVLALLIGMMWMGQPDPIGLRKWLPGASFLLPPRQMAAGKGVRSNANPNDEATPTGPAARSLDDVPGLEAAAEESQAAVPVASEEPAAADPVIPAEPAGAATPPLEGGGPGRMSTVATAPAAEPAAAIPVIPVPDPEPAEPNPDVVVGAVPVFVPAPMPPEPEPEPLDLEPLDTAVAAATEATSALVEAPPDAADRRPLMISWYRSLSRVAEALAAVEASAAETNQPLDEPLDRLTPLMPGLVPDGELAADLARLSRNWLAFARRDSDGIVLPVTFDSTRRVGPFWCSKVLIEEADGETREVSVVSRQRPFAELGERCLVIGVLFDGGTVWAADVRSVEGRPATASEPNPSEPAPSEPAVPEPAPSDPAVPEPVAEPALPGT